MKLSHADSVLYCLCWGFWPEPSTKFGLYHTNILLVLACRYFYLHNLIINVAFISVVPLCRLPRSANQRFTYRAGTKLPAGTLVRIPFRNSKIGGVVVKIDAAPKK